jgi:hypothetical protein
MSYTRNRNVMGTVIYIITNALALLGLWKAWELLSQYFTLR